MRKTVLIFSDSHNSSLNMEQAVRDYPLLECVIHLGDGEDDTRYLKLPVTAGLLTVAGNCDITSRQPRYLRVNICGLDIIMCHGDAYGVKRGYDRYEYHALEQGCDIALFGHTHTPYKGVLQKQNGVVTVFNPGSISRPVYGRPSYGVLTVDGDRYELIHKTI